MIEYPEIDKYASLNSPIHRFDPRAKIISFLFLIFSIALLPDLKLAFIGFVASIFLLIFSKLPFSFVIHYLKWIFLFISPFLIIMPFSVEGKEIFNFYGMKMTQEGLIYGLLISVRAVSAVILIFPMIATMKFEKTLKALNSLKVPNILVQILMFSYRYIFTFIEEFQNMLRAMQSRGFKLKANSCTLEIMGKAVGMLFVKGYERSERVYQAMQARGYSGNPKILTEFKMRIKDYILAACIIGFAVFLHIILLIFFG